MKLNSHGKKKEKPVKNFLEWREYPIQDNVKNGKDYSKVSEKWSFEDF